MFFCALLQRFRRYAWEAKQCPGKTFEFPIYITVEVILLLIYEYVYQIRRRTIHYSMLCEWKTMAIVPTSVPKSDFCAIIQFFMLENVPGLKVHCHLCAAYKISNIVMKSIVNHWMKTFKEGWMSTDDEACSGCPCQIWGLTIVPLSWFFVHTTQNNEPFFAKLGVHTESIDLPKKMCTSTSLQCCHNMCTKQQHCKNFWTPFVLMNNLSILKKKFFWCYNLSLFSYCKLPPWFLERGRYLFRLIALLKVESKK